MQLKKDTMSFFNRDEVKVGKILSDDELKYWRYTYKHLKQNDKEEIVIEDATLCFCQLNYAAKRARLTSLEACDLLIEKQNGSVREMAKFLKDKHEEFKNHL